MPGTSKTGWDNKGSISQGVLTMLIENVVVVNLDEIMETICVYGIDESQVHLKAAEIFIQKCRQAFGKEYDPNKVQTDDAKEIRRYRYMDLNTQQPDITVLLIRPDHFGLE
jgi:hypothetical protein